MAEIRIGEEAGAEYAESLRWYDDRSPKAAMGFEAAIADKLEQIAATPDRFPACDVLGFRFAMLDRYPFGIIYRTSGEVVDVVAFAHGRRRPGYWARRR